MLIVFFAIWMLLNAHFALDIQFLEIVLFGICVTLLIYIFLIKFTKWNWSIDKFFITNIHLFIAYAFVLLFNVLKSNVSVLLLILNPADKPKPEIVVKTIDLNNDLTKVMLANSITLTPGTITIKVSGNKYLIHCLKEEYIEGIENSTLVKILQKMEGTKR